MTAKSLFIPCCALALVACSAKGPADHAAPVSVSANTAQDGLAVQKSPPLSDADQLKAQAAYPVAKLAAADFIIAHPKAAPNDVIQAAALAARLAGDPDARGTAEAAAADARDWVATRRSNGFPPRSTDTDLAANDAAADAALRASLAKISTGNSTAFDPATAGPDGPSRGAHYFPKVGTCFETRVSAIGTRLENAPDSGDEVEFADGHVQVSYEKSPVVHAFRIGDPIRLCVTDLPGHCPPTDDRGIGFVAIDARTGGRWEAGDAEHMCGGA